MWREEIMNVYAETSRAGEIVKMESRVSRERTTWEDEITLSQLVSGILAFKLTIIAAVLLSLLASAIIYFVVPRTYEAVTEIHPARQTALAPYLNLVAAGAFPYDRARLFQEFTSYIQDYSLRKKVAEGIISRSGKSEQDYQRELDTFARKGISFSTASRGPETLSMKIRGDDPQVAIELTAGMLREANTEFAQQINNEIKAKIAADTENRAAEIERLQTEIAARRKAQEARRQDDIERLTEQAKIAHLLGIAKPIGLPEQQSPTGAGTSIYVQTAGEQPIYLNGYLAIEEQIGQLRSRQDNDPYVAELRDLERRIFQLQNDKSPERIASLLKASRLGEPASPALVQYDLAAVTATKVFPRANMFGIAAVGIGLLAGLAIAFARSHAVKQ
jgi:chain length determinant protein (polysaccharide antigen chain regulator)